MQCPFCGQDHDKVVDSRSSEGGRVVRRRRQCLACDRRFTTYERPEEALRFSVVKRDGSREPYERQKVIAGLHKACYKRPVTDEQIRRIVQEARGRPVKLNVQREAADGQWQTLDVTTRAFMTIEQESKDLTAGYRPEMGDVITSINGNPVYSYSELKEAYGAVDVGATFKMITNHRGREMTSTFTKPEPSKSKTKVKTIH